MVRLAENQYESKGWQGLLLWGRSHGHGKEDQPEEAAVPTVELPNRAVRLLQTLCHPNHGIGTSRLCTSFFIRLRRKPRACPRMNAQRIPLLRCDVAPELGRITASYPRAKKGALMGPRVCPCGSIRRELFYLDKDDRYVVLASRRFGQCNELFNLFRRRSFR
jgi:hypothetical protein